MFNELLHEHAVLRSLAAEIRACVDKPFLADVRALAGLRGRFLMALQAHLTFENEIIDELMQRSGGNALRAIAPDVANALTCWLLEFRDHATAWPSERVASDWNRFRFAEAALMRRVEAYVDLEEVEVYPLLPGYLQMVERVH